jgi:hypothetical protein
MILDERRLFRVDDIGGIVNHHCLSHGLEQVQKCAGLNYVGIIENSTLF